MLPVYKLAALAFFIGSHAADHTSDRPVESRDNRSDGDDRAGSNNHAEHRQKRANLIFPQRGGKYCVSALPPGHGTGPASGCRKSKRAGVN